MRRHEDAAQTRPSRAAHHLFLKKLSLLASYEHIPVHRIVILFALFAVKQDTTVPCIRLASHEPPVTLIVISIAQLSIELSSGNLLTAVANWTVQPPFKISLSLMLVVSPFHSLSLFSALSVSQHDWSLVTNVWCLIWLFFPGSEASELKRSLVDLSVFLKEQWSWSREPWTWDATVQRL